MIYKILLNGIKLYKLKRFYSTYKDYIKKPNCSELNEKILEAKAEIIQILDDCGLKDFGVSQTRPTGFGYAEHKQISILQNLHCIGEMGEVDIPNVVNTYLIQARGILKKRIIEAFSPLYWINIIIFLPQKITTYLGFSLDDKKVETTVRVLNVIYWLLFVFIPPLLQFFGVKILIHIN